MSQDQIDILKRALEREKAARKAAEKILEEKSRVLYETSQKLEKLLDEKSSQLQGVFENIADAYVVMDLKGNVIKSNDAATALFGYDMNAESINVVNLIYKKDMIYAMNSFKELIQNGFFKKYEARIYTKSKEVKWVHINASLIYDKHKKPIAAQGIIRDVTLQRTYRKSLEAQKEKYSNIIANMNLGLVEVNNDDTILMVNQSFTKISGYSEKELLGKKASDIFLANTNSEQIEKENQKRRNGQSNSYELQVKDKQGYLKHWLVSGAPNYNLKGEVIGSIGIHLDITDIKTLELQKEKLLLKLAKSNDELQEYAHIVSHDLKSPLRSINALVSWLKEDNKNKLDEASNKNIEMIETTLEKMEQLISDVLDYSRVTSQNTKKESVDSHKIISELLNILLIPENIEIRVLNKLPTVQADKTKFQQIFQNLISNAIKFNDKEKGVIDVDYTEQEHFHKFSIKDNGIGIEPKYHDKIFKIFNALNPSKDSTGVGLAIVKKIISLYQGKIWLESDPGKGTTFHFTIKK